MCPTYSMSWGNLDIFPTWFKLSIQGGGVSESMDGRGCAILALELVAKNLIFA